MNTALSPSQQAAHLTALWNRLSNQHIALGCSCSMSGISVRLEDFERDIADYLWVESERWQQAGVVQFLLQDGPIAAQDKAIRNILQRIESHQASATVTQWLLPKLSNTIESYAKLHAPAPQAPLLGGSPMWRESYRM